MRRVIVILSVIFSFILSADLITAACTPGDRLCCDAGHFRTCQSGSWGACVQCAKRGIAPLVGGSNQQKKRPFRRFFIE